MASKVLIEKFVNPRLSAPLFRQISDGLRARIQNGELKAGDKLPSLRKFAELQGVSVDTVQAAFGELYSQGLISSKSKSGYYVCIPAPQASSFFPCSDLNDPYQRKPSGRMLRAADAAERYEARPERKSVPFVCYGAGSISLLTREWTAKASVLSRSPWQHNQYSSPAGFFPLRSAIAENLRRSRGISCSPEEIIITSGTVQALSLTTSLLLNPGDSVILEFPSLPFLSEIFRFRGINILYAPVDEHGINPEKLLTKEKSVRAILLSSSSQYPMSVTLSKERRSKILEWALDTEGWILEDDIDNVMWHVPERLFPIRSMRHASECTVYIDSFSLQFFPGLRLGYIVVPRSFAKAFAGTKLLTDRQSGESTQALLADFLKKESYAAHIRRLQKNYCDNFKVLRGWCSSRLKEYGTLSSTSCGPHAAFFLQPAIPDQKAYEALMAKSIFSRPLSSFSLDSHAFNGLVLGFGGFPKHDLEEALCELEQTLQCLIL